MSSVIGFVQAGLMLAEDAILVKPKRGFESFTAQVVLTEVHDDVLDITDHPVEQGAVISDHAYKKPSEVMIEMGWSNSPGSSGLIGSLVSAVTGTIGGISSLLTGNSVSQVKDIYMKLILLQESRVLFDVYTGKRTYNDMLIKSLHTETDKNTENALYVKAVFREVIVVKTSTTAPAVDADPEDQEAPEDTEPTEDEGTEQLDDADTYNEADGDESLAGEEEEAPPPTEA